MFYSVNTFTQKVEDWKITSCEVLKHYEEPMICFYNQILPKPERIILLYFGHFLNIFSLSPTKNENLMISMAGLFLKLEKSLDQNKIRNYLLIFKIKLQFFNVDLLKIVMNQLENFLDFETFWTEILPFGIEKTEKMQEFVAFKEKLDVFISKNSDCEAVQRFLAKNPHNS